MAKRVAKGNSRRTSRAKSILPDTSVAELKKNLGGYNYKNLMRKFRGNPLLVNAGIGVGAFFLVRFAVKYYKGHPEIKEFIRENLDTVESKFRDLRSSGDDISDARH